MTDANTCCHASGRLADIKPDDSMNWVGYRIRSGAIWWANYRSAAYNGQLVVAGSHAACEAAERLFAMKDEP